MIQGISDDESGLAGVLGTHAHRRVLPALFVVQFLSWSGMFCLWIYAVPAISTFVLHAHEGSGRYHTAIIVISACFALYSLIGAGLAFAVPFAAARLGFGILHGLALIVGGMGIILLGLSTTPLFLPIWFAAIGVGWASMSNIPYVIAGAVAPEGRGAHFMKMFGFSTVLPQIAISLGLAVAAPNWLLEASYRVLVGGGVLMTVGGLVAIACRRLFDVKVGDW